MNVERFHAILLAVRDDLQHTGETALLQQLASAARQLANQPADPSSQQLLSEARTQLMTVLRDAPSNNFSPAWRQALDELELSDDLGTGLRTTIASIFSENTITPTTAAEQIEPIAARVQNLDAQIAQTLAGFEHLGVGAEELDAGSFEIGFSIPRPAVDQELWKLGQEFEQLSKVLGPFLEIATGSRAPLHVRSIGSTAFEVYLAAAPTLAFTLAKTVESLITSYEKILAIREKRQGMVDAGVPEEALQAVDNHADKVMTQDIERLIEERLAEAQRQDDARINELRTELRHSMNALANRIDRGYSIEIRAGELPPADETAEDDEKQELRRQIDAVRDAQRTIRFINLAGAPILQLNENADDDSGDPGAAPPTT